MDPSWQHVSIPLLLFVLLPHINVVYFYEKIKQAFFLKTLSWFVLCTTLILNILHICFRLKEQGNLMSAKEKVLGLFANLFNKLY